MSRVVLDISTSLDGFVADPGGVPQGLHDWAFGPPQGSTDGTTAASVPDTWRPDAVGAVIAGRRTYEDSLPSWGPDGPSLGRRLPVVVLAHGDVTEPPPGGVYSVAGSLDDALARARALAGDRDVSVMGGGSTGGQFLAAGLLDEVKVHLVPVVLADGVRLFGGAALPRGVRLEPLQVDPGERALHLRYAVVRSTDGS